MSHILGKDLVGRLDQYLDVLRFESEIGIELPAYEIIELLDRRTALIARRDADRVQEWQFEYPVLREEVCGFVAVRDDREKV